MLIPLPCVLIFIFQRVTSFSIMQILGSLPLESRQVLKIRLLLCLISQHCWGVASWLHVGTRENRKRALNVRISGDSGWLVLLAVCAYGDQIIKNSKFPFRFVYFSFRFRTPERLRKRSKYWSKGGVCLRGV